MAGGLASVSRDLVVLDVQHSFERQAGAVGVIVLLEVAEPSPDGR